MTYQRQLKAKPMYQCKPVQQGGHGVGTEKRCAQCKHVPMPTLYSYGNDVMHDEILKERRKGERRKGDRRRGGEV